MRVLSTLKYTVYRLLRNYLVLLLLLVVPIVLLTAFYFIFSDGIPGMEGNFIQEQSVIMVLVFQMFGGSIVMSYIYEDLFTHFRERLYILPFNQTLYAFSILMCGTLFSVLLGIIIMIYTHFALGVIWGNWFWAIYIIALIAVLSSVVCLIFTFSVKKFSTAERLSEVYGVGFVLLAGLFFPLPDNAFFNFMSSYGNPITLGAMSIEEMNHANSGAAWFPANIILAAIALLFIVMLILGRRKLS